MAQGFTVATADGSDPTILGQPVGTTSPILTFDSLDTNGSTFMLGLTQAAGATTTGFIATTDGKAAPAPYLTPSDGSLYDYAVYTGSYVAWLKGIGSQSDNLFTKVEVWASTYDPDPAKLAPFKVTDYPFTAMSTLVGAGGRIAYFLDPSTMAVWDLATLTQSAKTLPPNQAQSVPYMGMTSTHLWVKAAQPPASENPTDMIVRFALP
jgi:hypothetical protein